MGILAKAFVMALALAACGSIIYLTTTQDLESVFTLHKTFGFKVAVLIGCITAICALVPLIVSRIKTSIHELQKKAQNKAGQAPAPQYVVRKSTTEYEAEGQAYTQKCLRELMQSEAYKKMRQEKGEDKTRWNWQTRESAEGGAKDAEEDEKLEDDQ